ncbi:phenylalanine 4-monooxygenase [Eisenibacter elegans]|jgi:phenylalanine-4-hydroxylase|uniref:phenylalanine 4-monooxygenase n=1 Tax=Eisenibacter elegans TaxID=997 RepID=UPI0009D73ED1|nr:phenylalanine 4-monooxygenase [Eisenibacter elegans]
MNNDFRNLVQRDPNTGYYEYNSSLVLKQEYDQYTTEDHKVWQILYDRQMEQLPGKATADYITGIKTVKFEREHIPNFEAVNEILQNITGWRVHVVPGLIPNREFFELMRSRNFCATTWLRTMEQLDYLVEPDMFHDVFGHVPLLTNQPLCDFLVDLSDIALKYLDSEVAIECVARLYWYTVEFGLIQEAEGLRIYGAGILSSSGETNYSLYSEAPKRLPYDVKTIINTPYIKDRYQEQYFVINSYEQLYSSVSEIDRCIAEAVELEKAGKSPIEM